ncbi:hypothetical protein O6P43_034148 [Quillaja saponaria]|uniref:Uncharacterized protein n=1 Tax=Quillaja saponaria TaxID=32244 RepID=A0AAD7KSG6_QUISA|nr:hypothetical protein O6P43_034148 [Quillaja saponaria]
MQESSSVKPVGSWVDDNLNFSTESSVKCQQTYDFILYMLEEQFGPKNPTKQQHKRVYVLMNHAYAFQTTNSTVGVPSKS